MSHGGVALNEDALRSLPSAVSRIAQGLLLLIGVASTAISIAGEWSHGNHYLHEWLVENVTVMGALLHVLLIILILFPGRIRLLNEDVEDHTVRLLVRCLNKFFVRAWTWIWVSFGLLYAVGLYRTLGPESSHPVVFGKAGYGTAMRVTLLMDVFNVASTLFILLTYAFLSPGFLRDYVRTAKALEAQGKNPDNWFTKLQFWAPASLIVCLGCAALCFRSSILYCIAPSDWDAGITVFLGIASAVVMAYFAGRMDSKFVLNWQWVVVVLFIYAAIQVYSGALYGDQPIPKAIFTYSAFTMKCVLFIFMSNFFESRRVVYYAVELVQAENRTL